MRRGEERGTNERGRRGGQMREGQEGTRGRGGEGRGQGGGKLSEKIAITVEITPLSAKRTLGLRINDFNFTEKYFL